MNLTERIRNSNLSPLIEDILEQYPQIGDKTSLLSAAEESLVETQDQYLDDNEAIDVIHRRITEAAKESLSTVYDTCANQKRVSELARWCHASDPTDTTIAELYALSAYLVNNCLARWRAKFSHHVLEEIESEGKLSLMKAIHSLKGKENFDADGILKYFSTWIYTSMRDYTQRSLQIVKQPRRVSEEVFHKSTGRHLKSTVSEITTYSLDFLDYDRGIVVADDTPDKKVEDIDHWYDHNKEHAPSDDIGMLDNPFDILEEKNYDTIEKFIAAKLYEGEKKGDIALALGITASAISAHIKTMRTKWRTYN